MSIPAPTLHADRPTVAIVALIVAMSALSVQDVLVKQLSSTYPLSQIVYVRSLIGIFITAALLHFDGGLTALRTKTPGLHILRGVLIVVANMTYFAAIVVLPIAEATAVFFVAPLLITLLAAVLLNEGFGPRRLVAIILGFVGVLLIVFSATSGVARPVHWSTYLLPLASAIVYAFAQIITRHIGPTSKTSALALYLHLVFVCVAATTGLAFGDGQYAHGIENFGLLFLLRAWQPPTAEDWLLFIGIGVLIGMVFYLLSYAYRAADAGAIAPFEYVAMPLAVFWGWFIWNEIPSALSALGIIFIAVSGGFVFLSERRRAHPKARRSDLAR